MCPDKNVEVFIGEKMKFKVKYAYKYVCARCIITLGTSSRIHNGSSSVTFTIFGARLGEHLTDV